MQLILKVMKVLISNMFNSQKRIFLLLRFRRMVFMYLIVNLKMQETWMGMEAMKSHFILLDIRPVGMITISGHIKMGNG